MDLQEAKTRLTNLGISSYYCGCGTYNTGKEMVLVLEYNGHTYKVETPGGKVEVSSIDAEYLKRAILHKEEEEEVEKEKASIMYNYPTPNWFVCDTGLSDITKVNQLDFIMPVTILFGYGISRATDTLRYADDVIQTGKIPMIVNFNWRIPFTFTCWVDEKHQYFAKNCTAIGLVTTWSETGVALVSAKIHVPDGMYQTKRS